MRNRLGREELPGSRTSLTVMFERLSVVFSVALLFCSITVTASGQAQVAAQPASETPATSVSPPDRKSVV